MEAGRGNEPSLAAQLINVSVGTEDQPPPPTNTLLAVLPHITVSNPNPEPAARLPWPSARANPLVG